MTRSARFLIAYTSYLAFLATACGGSGSVEVFVVGDVNPADPAGPAIISVFDTRGNFLRTLGSLPRISGIAIGAAQHELYLLDSGDGSPLGPRIVVFDQTASQTTDSQTLRALNLKVPVSAAVTPTNMDFDATYGEMFVTFTQGGPCTNPFVCHYDYPEGVAVYSSDASGDTFPLRILHGAATGLTDPSSVAVDAVQDEIFVTYGDTVAVFRLYAYGDEPPKRTISGDGTGLHGPHSVRVAPRRNEIFVANGNDAITIYGREVSGNVAFSRAIYGPATGLNGLTDIVVDVDAGEIYAANVTSVTVYDIAANGNVAPLRVLPNGIPPSGIGQPRNLALADAGGFPLRRPSP